jgi:hypothetical protein
MTNTNEILPGQVWTRRHPTAGLSNPITILEDITEPADGSTSWFLVQKDGGGAVELTGIYIQSEFQISSEHLEAITFEDLDGVVLTVQPGHAYAENLLLEMSVPGQIVLRPGQIDDLVGWLQTHRRLNGDN